MSPTATRRTPDPSRTGAHIGEPLQHLWGKLEGNKNPMRFWAIMLASRHAAYVHGTQRFIAQDSVTSCQETLDPSQRAQKLLL
jgi:hypothetical protein